MNLLANLKLVTVKRQTKQAVEVLRRNKVIERLAEQIEMAKAKDEGRVYVATRQRKVKNGETGENKTVETAKRLREWWWVAADGKKMNITLKYGTRVIEITKGKTAVEIASEKELVATLEMLKKAVGAGELDGQIEAAAGAVKAGFRK